MTKYVDLEGLQTFKTKQDAETAAAYAAKSSIPTKISKLDNDAGYQTAAQVSTAVSSSLNGYAKASHAHAISDVSNLQAALDNKASTAHTHPSATTTAAGLMSASDKSKLDGIAAGANAYSLPTATSSVLGGVKTGNNITNSGGTISLTKSNVVAALGYTPPTADTNTTYGVVSTANDGLAPKRDGSTTKFLRADGTWAVPPDTNTTYSLGSFGITATAKELNYMDGVTSNVQTQLNGKAASSHTHDYLPLSGGTLTGNVQVNGATKINNHMYFTLKESNGTSANQLVYATRTDGSSCEIMHPMNGANNFVLGYGLWYDKRGSTRIYGNGIDMFSYNTITADVPVLQHAITVACSSAKTLSTSWSKLTMGSNYGYSAMTLFELSGGGVKCKFTGSVMVTAQMYYSSVTADDAIGLTIANGSERVAESWASTPKTYGNAFYAPKIFYVDAGDVLYLYAQNYTAARGSVAADHSTFMSVWYVE